MFAVLATAGAVAVVLFVLGRKAIAPGVDPTQLSFDPSVMEEVRRLTLDGHKIQAIALLREQTPGLSVGAAKTMVDRMELSAKRRSGAGPDQEAPAPAVRPSSTAPPAPPALAKPSTPVRPAGDDVPSSAVLPLDVELEVRSLMAQDQRIAAIALVREHIDFGLAEASDYVDGL